MEGEVVGLVITWLLGSADTLLRGLYGRVARNKIELIQRDKLLGAEEKRRRMDKLLARRNDLVFQAVNHNRQNWE